MPLFQQGRFTFHSGSIGSWKIDCDALGDDDLETLASLVAERASPFSAVEGVPRGGLRLAERLRPYTSMMNGGLLIVDDVNTSGASLEAHRAGRPSRGFVIFNRGVLPLWARALFTLDAYKRG